MAGHVARILKFWWVAWLGSLLAMVVAMLSMQLRCPTQLSRVQYSLDAFASALEAYRAKEGNYPGQSLGLNALVPGYLRRASRDSWANPYVYRRPDATSKPQVYSVGVDGVDSGGGGDDVTPAPKKYRCEDYGTNCPPTFRELVLMASGVLFVLSTLVGVGRTLLWCARKLSSVLRVQQ